MTAWNAAIRTLARITHFRRGFYARFLRPATERHARLFGRYAFEMDLRLGRLQKIYYLKPGSYERDTERALRGLVRPRMTVLDIGANSGYTTLLLADLVGREGTVHAFEPMPILHDLLARNVRGNGLAHVQVHAVALSDREGTVTLHLDPHNDGGNTIGAPQGGEWQGHATVCVPTTTLDRFVNTTGVPRIDVIKIDVEGAETLVFAGAQALLSREDAPVIVAEVGDDAQKLAGTTAEGLRAMLRAQGYASFWLDGRSCAPEERIVGLQNLVFAKPANVAACPGFFRPSRANTVHGSMR